MEEPQSREGGSFLLSEPADLSRITTAIHQLLENDMALEAVARFSNLRPPDQADVMAGLGREPRAELLGRLTAETLGPAIGEMKPADAVELSQGLEPERLSLVLDQTSPDVAADILRGLSGDLAATTLRLMEKADDVAPLLEYEDDDAGGLMTPEFLALHEEMTVAEAMAFVRRWSSELDPEDVSYLLVIDGDGVLKGGLSLAELVLARPYQRVSILMRQNPISVPVDTDQEHCARLMEHYNLHKLPVVDDRSRLAGVLNLADMMEVLEDEATEDMYKIFGVDEEEKAMGPFWRSVRGRLPWLCVNLATAMLAGFIVTLFQSTLVQAVALAAFLPVIAGQGGIAGTQTLTLIVRSLALGEISSDNGKRLLAKEIGLGLVHGVALGALAGIVALVWKGSEYLALVVAVAMLANLVVAGASGVLVPLGFRALRIDPALASAVAVTTFTDVIGFLVYLGLAALLIRLIVGSL